MEAIKDIAKFLGFCLAFFLFVVGVTILTRPAPPQPGIIAERWYDDQYVGGYFFAVGGREYKVTARTYFRYKKGDWYEGEK